MNSDILRDKAEYLMSLISHFAERNGLSIPQAYRYVKRYGGICLVDEHYDIMHTLSFTDALESMTMYMKRQGGAVGSNVLRKIYYTISVPNMVNKSSKNWLPG